MYKPATDYAVTLIGVGTTPLRPLRATWNGVMWEIHDPDDPLDFPLSRTDKDVKVHGEWNSRTHPLVHKTKTWSEFAAEQLSHVQRQRDLAKRLTGVGIVRAPEPYIRFFDTSRAIDTDLTLTYDEIDLLLRRGGA